jgi:hypothetical protein
MYYVPIRIGRAFDRQPPDKVQTSVLVAGLSSVIFLLWLLLNKAALATIGTLTLAGYGIALGSIGIAPFIIRAMMRSDTYQKMDSANAKACCLGVCFTASVFVYGALLLINDPAPETKAFTSQFTIEKREHGTRQAKNSQHIDIRNSTYGWRQNEMPREIWLDTELGAKLTLILQTGRLGYPVIIGYQTETGSYHAYFRNGADLQQVIATENLQK